MRLNAFKQMPMGLGATMQPAPKTARRDGAARAELPSQADAGPLGKVVQTCNGVVRGSTDGSVTAFLGLRYAAAPIGDLRWRPPQPPADWAGVKAADSFGMACCQPDLPGGSILRLLGFDEPRECAIGEDCLHLNVWTGARRTDDRLPVIVFVHGGAHQVGAGSHPVSRGTNLARRGAVVVTLNYRLGALGYFAHPALTCDAGWSGNYALLDIVQALTWVRDNIANFGGDPDRVTLWGQSAGAQLVATLMTLPLARGLFHRVIGGSGGAFRGGGLMGRPMPQLTAAERIGEAIGAANRAAGLDELRRLPPEAFAAPRGTWRPILDGTVVERSVDEVFDCGTQAPVPLLVGFLRDEATIYPAAETRSSEALLSFVHESFGPQAGAILRSYGVAAEHPLDDAGYRLRRDLNFAYQAWAWASAHARTGSATFLYQFDQPPSPLPGRRFDEHRPDAGYGAWHGAELWYAFGTIRHGPFQASVADDEMAETFMGAIIAFARDGNPGAAWRQFREGSPTAVRLAQGRSYEAAPDNLEQLRLLDAHFRER